MGLRRSGCVEEGALETLGAWSPGSCRGLFRAAGYLAYKGLKPPVSPRAQVGFQRRGSRTPA